MEDGQYVNERRRNPGKRAIDILSGNCNEVYVKYWLDQPWMPNLRRDPSFRSFFNTNKLAKEMSESWSVFQQIKSLVAEYKEDELVFFDMCSGKGYLSCLLSFAYPQAKIFQIDNNKKMNLSHVDKLPNVSFKLLNINDKVVIPWMMQKTEGKIGVLLGIHLCGLLSERAIRMYSEISDIKYLVLSPCCLPKSNDALMETSRSKNIDCYELWTMQLYFLCLKKECRLKVITDKNVLSEKNNFIIAFPGARPDALNEKMERIPSLLSQIKKEYCSYCSYSQTFGI